MPRLRQPKVSDTPKPFDSSMLKAKDDEPLHDNEVVIEDPEPEKEAEPVVVKAEEPPEPPKEDPALALQKQLEDLKKSEEIQRNMALQAVKERDEAIKRTKEREVEVTKFQKEATQAQYDHLSTALAAAQESSEAAKRDIKVGITNADPDLQAEAYERLATARANISKLEDGKYELETRLRAEKAAPKVEPKQEPPVPQKETVDDFIARQNVTNHIRGWIGNHREIVTDADKWNDACYFYGKAQKAGLDPNTEKFTEFMEEKLGMRQAKEEPKQEQQRTNIVSAPVSREVPSSSGTRQNSGKITLTKEQAEYARISGITETEYARQLTKLNEAKANGQYTGGQ